MHVRSRNVTSRTKRQRDSAVPYLQELLNKDHFKRRKELKSLLDAGSSQSYEQRQNIKPKKHFEEFSEADQIKYLKNYYNKI